jgi:hypothetical protein
LAANLVAVVTDVSSEIMATMLSPRAAASAAYRQLPIAGVMKYGGSSLTDATLHGDRGRRCRMQAGELEHHRHARGIVIRAWRVVHGVVMRANHEDAIGAMATVPS